MKLSPIKILGILLFSSILTSATCSKSEVVRGGKDCPDETSINVTVSPKFQITKAFLDDPDSSIEGLVLTYDIKKTYCEGDVSGSYTKTITTSGSGYADPSWNANYNLTDGDKVSIHVYGGGKSLQGNYKVNFYHVLNLNSLIPYDKSAFYEVYSIPAAW